MDVNVTEHGTGTQKVLVDTGKLSRGLKTAFEGVAMIFESLGVDDIPDIAGAVVDQTKSAGTGKDAGQGAKKEDVLTKAEKKPDVQEAAALKEKSGADGEVQETGNQKSAPVLTLDDVTKVIVQKIRKDRSNNEKIGEILKKFNAGKVSDLRADKYEAFLTELAAL